ncbi:cation transporter [Halorientalis sp. IM1011]|uniref:cation diffusion facilitator family transporter n=1 Tax=Halorientalis sp. IM1011 TaxID=1932360 RepID=UPI00097CD518|nr:cation diffusion facilitator family transporter [Halorientalis sp. IM1011]AQL42479.1 cation transporter [Halorientalis sp. IM1011]
MAGNSKGVVIAALIANGAIAIMKFVGYLLTLSPAMLSETYHSISDTGNQVFLLIGIRYGARDADRRHPFGYGKAQFFFAFLVSVMLFGIAGWESARHGYEALVHGVDHAARQPTIPLTDITLSFPPVYVNYAVLIGAIVFETYAFWKARKELKRQIDVHDWSGYKEAFRKTSDVTTLTAFTEDFIALAGAGIALFGVYLSNVTGNSVYDAAAALIIGLMLMGFAIALAWENKRLLMGESLPRDEEGKIRELVAGWDGVDEVVDLRTVYFGAGQVLITTDVAFAADLTAEAREETIADIEAAIREVEPFADRIYVEPVD